MMDRNGLIVPTLAFVGWLAAYSWVFYRFG